MEAASDARLLAGVARLHSLHRMVRRRFMKMTLEQHRELGERVKEFRETLMQPQVMCIGNKSSRESRAVANALKHLDRMKNELDNVVCRDFPECEDATRIYYGMSAAWIAREAKSSNAPDQRPAE